MAKKEKNSENKIQRIGREFDEEMERIKKKRLDLGMDKKKLSTRLLTNIIIKHDRWIEVSEDIIALNIKGVNHE